MLVSVNLLVFTIINRTSYINSVFIQKQPLKVHHRKTPVLESLFSKFVGFQACNLIKKRLQHRWFPVNIAKFLWNLFCKTSANDCFCLLHIRTLNGVIPLYVLSLQHLLLLVVFVVSFILFLFSCFLWSL